MSYFAKIWTDIFHDQWFMSLSGLERGVWIMMIITAKMRSDNGSKPGKFRYRNTAEMQHLCGIHRISALKMLQKLQKDGKISCTKNDDGSIDVEIYKYEYWQQVKGKKDGYYWKRRRGYKDRINAVKQPHKCGDRVEKYSLTENISKETTEKIAGGDFSVGQEREENPPTEIRKPWDQLTEFEKKESEKGFVWAMMSGEKTETTIKILTSQYKNNPRWTVEYALWKKSGPLTQQQLEEIYQKGLVVDDSTHKP